ncbi:hypothetical protein OAD62_01090 [Oceanihabitans sp.]|nr:hypothetical protein [Oceanihabitans sp.]
MELVITSQDLEPLLEKEEELVNKPLGFLTSNYKQIVINNFNSSNSHSLFGIRQRMKSRQMRACTSIETVLKVSLFLVFFFFAIN